MAVGLAPLDSRLHKAAAEDPCRLRGHRCLFPQPNITPCPAEEALDFGSESMAVQSFGLWQAQQSVTHLSQPLPPQIPSPHIRLDPQECGHLRTNLPRFQSNQTISRIKRSVAPEPCVAKTCTEQNVQALLLTG